MKLLIILGLLYTSSILAADYKTVDPVHFEIKSEKISEKFERAMQNPGQLLLRLRPEGAVISQKQVSSNSISFIATKKFLFVSKSVYVQGQLDIQENNQACGGMDVGYKIVLNLDGSDSLVTNNVDYLEVKLCAKITNNQNIDGTVHAKIFKGNHFSKALGPLAINMIEAQVTPLVRALTEEIKLMK